MALGISYLYLSLSLIYLIISVDAYTPTDLFSISCGSVGNPSSNDGRTWSGDVNTKFLSSVDKPSVIADSLTQSPSASQIPYKAARLSQSEFTYSFQVSAGQKFVRLFFYPASYGGFDRSNAVFSVQSGGFTLLKDFNASLSADADRSDIVFREYSVNVDDGETLNLTFIPNTTHPNSYAFINGIEILSMPTNLYNTNPDGSGLPFLGSTTRFSIRNSTALETKFRLNVGGSTLQIKQDTGMLRLWENDDGYINQGGLLAANHSDRSLKFDKIPNYTAPVEVYKTGRSTGKNTTINYSYNLTWEFTVDPGFNYMVRLHFCEFDPHIQYIGDRVFYVYIADYLAEDQADILRWTVEWGAPTYRDYVVYIVSENQKAAIFSVKLHPQSRERTLYSEAILMGLEVFKISDAVNKLAGPNPDPLPPSLNPPTPSLNPPKTYPKESRSAIRVGAIATVVVSSTVLFSLLVFFVIRTTKKGELSKRASSPISKSASSLPSHLCRYFSMAEIRAASKDFDDALIIGAGGFGNVYLGYMNDGTAPDGTTPVAIKRLKSDSKQGALEFMTEIETLSKLRHRHLVSLIGYCNEGKEMILVYEFMARGTLRDYLCNSDNQPPSWKQRLHICIGAAQGLHYLHTGAIHNFIHRDVKTTNILLDENWVGKIADFGLSKIGPSDISRSHITTMVKGSFGYLDPEYYMRQRLTQKSDVYAFGVVLLEVLSGRPPLLRTADIPHTNLVDWAKKCHSDGVIDELVDPCLKGNIAPECLKRFSEMAMNCLLDDGTQRPSMNDIVWGLEFALQLQESIEDATLGQSQEVKIED